VSWLSRAGLLLDGADHKRYAAVMRNLTDQITYLAASWRNAPDGYSRLLALIGLVHADLCIAGHERQLAQSQKLLAAELERQVLPDGGHLSRNPSVLVELLLDLLPLRQCFAARGTASHTTLCLGEHSSAKVMRDARLEREIGGAPLRHPDRVACEVREGEGGAIALEASHDGYAERFGLIHTRTLQLDAAGTRL